MFGSNAVERFETPLFKTSAADMYYALVEATLQLCSANPISRVSRWAVTGSRVSKEKGLAVDTGPSADTRWV